MFECKIFVVSFTYLSISSLLWTLDSLVNVNLSYLLSLNRTMRRCAAVEVNWSFMTFLRHLFTSRGQFCTALPRLIKVQCAFFQIINNINGQLAGGWNGNRITRRGKGINTKAYTGYPVF